MTEKKSIAAALVAAQMEMGKALKQSNNPHFRSKYADLGNVMDACIPALNKAGIAVIQPTVDDENGRYVETVLIHGDSGEQLKCRVPLIVQKNDMQGYGSAVTYARRYGLMAMAGIAPEDDDGNAAAKAAPAKTPQPQPQPQQKKPDPQEVFNRMDTALKGAANKEALDKIWNHREFTASFDALPAPRQDELKTTYNGMVNDFKPTGLSSGDDLDGDYIPH